MATSQLTSVLQALSSAAFDDLSGLWRLAAPSLAEALRDLVPDLVDTWGEAAAAAAADWYDDYREAQGIDGNYTATVEPVGDLGGDALAGWAAEPLNVPEPDVTAARSRLEDGFQKRVANSANKTVTGAAKADPKARGWMRRTRPGACKFCIMVASRGGIYTETSSRFACHGHCYCEAVPAWGGRALPVHPYTPSQHPNTPEEKARVKQWIADNL